MSNYNLKFKIKNSFAGFTLVEIMVSTFIMVMVLGLFLANYREINSQSKLINAAYQIAGDIRLAQSYSMGSVQLGTGVPPVGGWGIHFWANGTASSYRIFADNNSNQKYDSGEEIRIIQLPSNITTTMSGGYGMADMVFFPPDPITYIKGSPSGEINIQLKRVDKDKIVYVDVNYLGLVDVRY
jgi:Tfp pilus assembly protein FimT